MMKKSKNKTTHNKARGYVFNQIRRFHFFHMMNNNNIKLVQKKQSYVRKNKKHASSHKSDFNSEAPVQESPTLRAVNYLELHGDDMLVNFAQYALDVYNPENHTEYKLVETFGENLCLHCRKSKFGTVYHCAFKAAQGEFAINTFHAEVLLHGAGILVLNFCQILYGYGTGCEPCDIHIFGCYSPTRSLQLPLGSRWQETEQAEDYIGYATNALEYYNKKYGTDYTFVRYGIIRCVHYDSFTKTHLNFVAKPRAAATDKASFKRFFAERSDSSPSGSSMQVVYCCILDDGQTRAGCEMCSDYHGKLVEHPLDGLWYGRPENEKMPHKFKMVNYW